VFSLEAGSAFRFQIQISGSSELFEIQTRGEGGETSVELLGVREGGKDGKKGMRNGPEKDGDGT